MNLIPLRTAVIAGTCAVALSFVALPAFADVDPNMASDPSASQTVDSTDPASADPTATDPTDATVDDGMDDSGEVGDDNGSDTSTDDGDATATAAPVVSLPAEKGTPKQHFADTVFTPKEITKKGIKVEYTGLTAGATYQPFYSTGQSGGELTDPKKASTKGTISFTYRLSKAGKKSFGALGAVYTIGLRGNDTSLDLTQQISVKYDSDLTWKPAERHGGKVTLTVSVDKDDAAGKAGDWKKAEVDFQKKVGTTWVTVKTVKTNAKGVASATITSGKKVWRAVLVTSRTVIGATSAGHKK